MAKKSTRSSTSSDDLHSQNLLANPDSERSPKFDTLAPPTPDTAKKVAAFFSFEPIERTIRFKAPLLKVNSEASFSESTMSGLRKSSSKFALNDIDSMVSKGKVVKKEAKAVPTLVAKQSAPKTDTSTIKASSSKKRKIQDPVDLNIRDCTDFFDSHEKLHNFNHLALDKVIGFHEHLVKEMELCKHKLTDSQKNEAAKGKKVLDVTKELHQIKAELQEVHLQRDRDIDESNEHAQASAAISIFQSRIKMAKEAEDKNFDRSTWDVEEWKRLVAELGGELISEKDAGKVVAEEEVQGLAQVAEENDIEGAGKQVDQGNEGNDA
ncbi:hypothetical protein L1987_63714 [Smallanthus sonchifolius]|uniref:Uncharacterized protein n=1 Tax=Smallanthus sonchifolius TaxID=185202 RepID=A0ACB9CE00_9ASTR|nr:hypothetical protein L1987_63714 [Smallanthus sonchifolius]